MLRSQKKEQQNSAARPASTISRDATGAENRVSPTPAPNVDLEAHKSWEA
jgi:hypothetical protein